MAEVFQVWLERRAQSHNITKCTLVLIVISQLCSCNTCISMFLVGKEAIVSFHCCWTGAQLKEYFWVMYSLWRSSYIKLGLSGVDPGIWTIWSFTLWTVVRGELNSVHEVSFFLLCYFYYWMVYPQCRIYLSLSHFQSLFQFSISSVPRHFFLP